MAGQMPAPSDPNGFWENGRRYHNFQKGLYIYPNDEPEQERLDIYHKIFQVARREKLHDAPLRHYGNRMLDAKERLSQHWPESPRILDLGTGTGIWAIEMCERYQQYEMLGVDVSLIQPEMIPPNLHLYQADFERPWAIGEDSCDMIHLRSGCGSVSNWGRLYRMVFQHLKPGYGYFEQVEIDLRPRCDDHTLPPDSPLVQWYNLITEATARSGKSVALPSNVRELLSTMGFTDIKEEVIPLPYNIWSGDQHLVSLGRWYNLGFTEGIEAMTLAPLYRYMGYSHEDVQRLVRDVTAASRDARVHAYNNL